MKKRYFLFALSALVLTMPMWGQNDNLLPSRTMTIEGTYNPALSKGEKITVASEQLNTERQVTNVQYVTDEPQVAVYERVPIQPFEANLEIEEVDVFSGFVSGGYGLRNNFDALMDLEFANSNGTVFGFDGYMEGWNTELDDDWRSKMFNSNAELSFMHSFDNISIAFDADYGYRRYNIRKGSLMEFYGNGLNRFNRVINEGSFFASILSVGDSPWDYYLQVGYQGFKGNKLIINDKNQDYDENILRLNGNISLPLESGILSVDYNQKSVLNDKYSTMTLTPAWIWSNEKTFLSLGANIDLRTKKEDAVLASPMVIYRNQMKTKRNIGILSFTEISGGLIDNDMRSLWTLSPYWSSQNKIKDGYTLVDIYSGLTFSFTDKVTMVIGNGFSYTKNALFQTLSDSIIVSSMLEQHNSGLFYNKLTIDAEMSSLLSMRFGVTHYDWTNKDLGKALTYKPVWDITLDSRFIITDAFDVVLSYNFSKFHKYNGKAINNMNNLSLSADYRFRNNLSLFADLNNIFNSRHYYYAGYMAQKFNFVIGAAYRF